MEEKNKNRRGRKPAFVPELDEPIIIKSHRIQYSSECVEKLKEFASLSKEMDKKEVKLKWNIWIRTKSVFKVLSAEFKRLNGHSPNPEMTHAEMLDKMYFSVRYYYCKRMKTANKEESPEDQEEQKPSRTYTFTPQTILEEMNAHIIVQLKTPGIKPAKAFEHYYAEYKSTLPTEYDKEKCKKIYKNRFFTVRTKVTRSSAPKGLWTRPSLWKRTADYADTCL